MAFCVYPSVDSGAATQLVALAVAPATAGQAVMYLTLVVSGDGPAPGVTLTCGGGSNAVTQQVPHGGPDPVLFAFNGYLNVLVRYQDVPAIVPPPVSGQRFQLVFLCGDATTADMINNTVWSLRLAGAAGQTFAWVVADNEADSYGDVAVPLLSARNATIEGGLAVAGATTLAGLAAQGAAISGTLSVAGPSTLARLATGDAAIAGALSVGGTTTLASLAALSGSIGGGLAVSGPSVLAGVTAQSETITGPLTVTGASTLANVGVNGALSVVGASTLTGLTARAASITGSLTAHGATIDGALTVTGASGLAGLTAQSAAITGSATVMANLGVGTASPAAKLQVTGGAIMPAVGNSESAGIQFPLDPGGGSGDRAFIRYFVGTGETTQLRVGIDNDPDDVLSLYQMGQDRLVISNGNIGIGTASPAAKLQVTGGAIMPAVGNAESAGIQFPPDPGGGGGDRAFIRYFIVPAGNPHLHVGLATTSETTQLRIGIDNDPDDVLSLYQMGQDRLVISNGNVGVGTASPAAKLQVTGGAIMPEVGNSESAGIQFPLDPGGGGGDRAFIRYFIASGETTQLRVGIDNDPDDVLSLWQMGADRLVISNGNIGINTASPGALLHIQQANDGRAAIILGAPTDGSKHFEISYEPGNDTVHFYHSNNHGQYMRLDGGWHQNSDASLKENVVALDGILDKVTALRPVSFDWKASALSGIGFLAQEVEPLFPDVVSEHAGADGKPVKGLGYTNFAVLAIAAVKELKSRYDERILALEERLAALTPQR